VMLVNFLKELLMFQRFIRSTSAVFLTLVIALNCFVTPAYAFTGDSFDSYYEVTSAATSVWKGFLGALGGVMGAAVGTVATCYAVDALIAPIAPPVAVYLAGVCPTFGVTVGGAGGFAGVEAALDGLN